MYGLYHELIVLRSITFRKQNLRRRKAAVIRQSFLPAASLWKKYALLTRVSDRTDDSFLYNDENEWRKPRFL